VTGVRSLKVTWIGVRLVGSASRFLGGLLTARLWFTPWEVPLSERAAAKQREWLKPTRPVRFSVAGREVRGFTAGEGPLVLLVHGWGERAASMGAFIAPLLDDGYRVVGIDMPAHGDSPGRQADGLIGAAVVRGVADELGGVHAVVAHSVGGMVTAYALGHGLEVDRVALIAASIRIEHAMEKFQGMFGVPEKAMAGLRETIIRRYGRSLFEQWHIDEMARGFTVPALLVHDTDDPQVDYADAKRLAVAWPGARLHTTHGLGHVKPTRDPAVIQEVRSFLREPKTRCISCCNRIVNPRSAVGRF
jgi:pimeloyl-ACP methyl ester carboxylesterase